MRVFDYLMCKSSLAKCRRVEKHTFKVVLNPCVQLANANNTTDMFYLIQSPQSPRVVIIFCTFSAHGEVNLYYSYIVGRTKSLALFKSRTHSRVCFLHSGKPDNIIEKSFVCCSPLSR